jgi:hypothetical protein
MFTISAFRSAVEVTVLALSGRDYDHLAIQEGGAASRE